MLYCLANILSCNNYCHSILLPSIKGKPWGRPARGMSVLSQPGSIGEPRDALMCAEFALVRGVEWRYLAAV